MTSTATISDVAKMAGVSIKTVSRVVNHEPNVKANTRGLVNQAIAELNYKPSLAARGLASGRSFLIGLLYDNLSDSFLVELQRGILGACREKHYGLALCPAFSKSIDVKTGILEWIRTTQPDGVILSPPLSDNAGVIDALKATGLKFVSVSSAGTGQGPAVHIDEAEAAQQMTRHLIEAGHTKIGFVKGPLNHACTRLRYEGFCAAMCSAGLAIDDALVTGGDFHFETGVEAAEKLLSGHNRPTAIFASNDDMAAGVMHVAHRKGLSIPSDLAVAGFDDTPISRQIWPGLSTVKQPVELIGRTATERLMAEILRAKKENGLNEAAADDEIANSDVLSFELMLRASTTGN